MWDLSFLTRDRTHVPCVGRWILNHWTNREVPLWVSLFPHLPVSFLPPLSPCISNPLFVSMTLIPSPFFPDVLSWCPLSLCHSPSMSLLPMHLTLCLFLQWLCPCAPSSPFPWPWFPKPQSSNPRPHFPHIISLYIHPYIPLCMPACRSHGFFAWPCEWWCLWDWVDPCPGTGGEPPADSLAPQRTSPAAWVPRQSSPSTWGARTRQTLAHTGTACLAGGCCGSGWTPGQTRSRFQTWQRSSLAWPMCPACDSWRLWSPAPTVSTCAHPSTASRPWTSESSTRSMWVGGSHLVTVWWAGRPLLLKAQNHRRGNSLGLYLVSGGE